MEHIRRDDYEAKLFSDARRAVILKLNQLGVEPENYIFTAGHLDELPYMLTASTEEEITESIRAQTQVIDTLTHAMVFCEREASLAGKDELKENAGIVLFLAQEKIAFPDQYLAALNECVTGKNLPQLSDTVAWQTIMNGDYDEINTPLRPPDDNRTKTSYQSQPPDVLFDMLATQKSKEFTNKGQWPFLDIMRLH